MTRFSIHTVCCILYDTSIQIGFTINCMIMKTNSLRRECWIIRRKSNAVCFQSSTIVAIVSTSTEVSIVVQYHMSTRIDLQHWKISVVVIGLNPYLTGNPVRRTIWKPIVGPVISQVVSGAIIIRTINKNKILTRTIWKHIIYIDIT